jgi:putative aldouronate transport system substrate-binding protein
MKKKYTKSILIRSLVLCLIIALCLLIVVNAWWRKKPSKTKQGYRFTFTYGWDKAQGAIPPSKAPDDPHFQYVEKKLGVVPLTQPYDWNGGLGYEQQVRLQLSGGKIPEAMQVFSETFVSELINMNILIPLDDLLPKYAPIYWKSLTSDDKALLRSFSPDGKIYFIAWKNQEPRVGMIRLDWLKRVGINKVPSTKDELLAAYDAFLKKDANGNGDPNDEVPVSGREKMRWLDDLYVMHGVAMYEGHPEWRWNEDKKQFISDQVSDEMKNAVAFISDLVKKGYMDKGMPIQKAGDWFARIQQDKIGHYFHTISGLERRLAFRAPGQDGKPALNPEGEFAYMPNVKVPGVPHQPNYAGGLTIELAITKKAKDPGKILNWYDWTWTKEGTTYKFFGIEGLNYNKVGGKIQVTENALSNKFTYTVRSGNRTKEVYEQMKWGDNMVKVYEASKKKMHNTYKINSCQ